MLEAHPQGERCRIAYMMFLLLDQLRTLSHNLLLNWFWPISRHPCEAKGQSKNKMCVHRWIERDWHFPKLEVNGEKTLWVFTGPNNSGRPSLMLMNGATILNIYAESHQILRTFQFQSLRVTWICLRDLQQKTSLNEGLSKWKLKTPETSWNKLKYTQVKLIIIEPQISRESLDTAPKLGSPQVFVITLTA